MLLPSSLVYSRCILYMKGYGTLQNANTVAIISYDSAAVLATLVTRDEADLQNLVGTICTVQDNLFIPFFSQIN